VDADISHVAAILRLLVLASVSTGLLRFLPGTRPLPVVSWALVFVVLGSAAMGIEYSSFWLPAELEAARERGESTRYHYYNLSAAVVFAGAQMVAALQVTRGSSQYIAWLLPAVAYIVLIGLVGAVCFGIPIVIVADIGRALLILALVALHERARRAGSD